MTFAQGPFAHVAAILVFDAVPDALVQQLEHEVVEVRPLPARLLGAGDPPPVPGDELLPATVLELQHQPNVGGPAKAGLVYPGFKVPFEINLTVPKAHAPVALQAIERTAPP